MKAGIKRRLVRILLIKPLGGLPRINLAATLQSSPIIGKFSGDSAPRQRPSLVGVFLLWDSRKSLRQSEARARRID